MTTETIQRRRTSAFFLSLLFPGGGQIYNGQLQFGAYSFLVLGLLAPILGRLSFASTFAGGMLLWVLFVLGRLAILVQAVSRAGRQREIPRQAFHKKATYLEFGVAALLYLFLLDYALPARYQSFDLSAGNMRPTFQVGDKVTADKLYYQSHKMQRGDLVLIRVEASKEALFPSPSQITIGSRVVGLGGETISFTPRSTTINGKVFEDPWAYYEDRSPRGEELNGTFKIPEGQVFVMGDNRDHSEDSRSFGGIREEDLEGKLIYLWWAKNLSRLGDLTNR